MKSGKSITTAQIDDSSLYPCYGGNGIRGRTKNKTHSGDYALIGRQGALCGNVFGVSGDFYASEHAVVVTPSDEIEIKWLTFVLKKMGLNQYSESSAQPGLSVSKILKLEVKLPPTKAEQEAIAEVLLDADAWIESLEKLIAKKRNLKQAAMQQLLTGQTRLPGFEGKWVERRLGDLGELIKGTGVSRNEANSGDIPCVRYGELYTFHAEIIRSFNSCISQDIAKNALRLKAGDILFAGSGETKEEIGKCAAYCDNMEAYAGGDIVVLRQEKNGPKFLGYILNSDAVVEQKSSYGQGDAVVHISAKSLAKVQVSLPAESEQTAIAKVLADMDTEIEALEGKLEKARRIKEGMMAELLTGKTRLVEPKAVPFRYPDV